MCCQGSVFVRTLAAGFCILESVQGFAGEPKQDPNAVVQEEGDKCMEEGLEMFLR